MGKHYVSVDSPTIHHSRSRFDLSYGVKMSANVGTLYPCYLQEIYPGDSFNCDTAVVTRLASSFFRPVMDNLFVDVMFFFVPSRLVFDKWEEIFGENRQSKWVQPSPVSAPKTPFYSEVTSKSVADYLGLPVTDIASGKVLPKGINILPFRCFARVYEDWWRDENLIAPMLIQNGSYNISEAFNGNAWAPGNYTGMCPKVSKFHDIFTSALPGTQKSNNPVRVPILQDIAPVKANALEGLHSIGDPWQIQLNTTTDRNIALQGYSALSSDKKIINGFTGTQASGFSLTDWNLYADLADAGQINVTDMRYAFQLQRILERAARTGTRYTEYLLGAFGVSSPDARLQRSEYLGGKRMPLSVQQVAQSVRGEEGSTQLGSLGAFSLSNGKCGYEKGFVEHGFVVGTLCIRQYHNYQQSIEPMWMRSDRWDYYDPILANISEVPVYKSCIYGYCLPNALDPTDVDDVKANVFGFQEAWYDLRKRMNIVTGDMRTDSATSYDIWHFADYYNNAPTLNQAFVEETPVFVDRTIPVHSDSADQFIIDIYHKQTGIRVLPTYSIPGLVDHH